MDDRERAKVLELIRETARGERPTDGRDEVAAGPRLMLGGMHGRALELAIVDRTETEAERRYVLSRDRATIAISFAAKGEWIFAHGDLRIEVADREAGAAFGDAFASWVGMPLAEDGSLDAASAPTAIVGSWVKLGVQRDADGIDWNIFKLFAGDGDGDSDDDDHGELFLRLSTERAVFTEKWSQYRETWIRRLEASFGRGRLVRPRQAMKICSEARCTVPLDWIVTNMGGHWRATDRADEAAFEVSWQAFGADPGMPSARERLSMGLAAEGRAGCPITSSDRGDIELAWAEYEYESDDSHGGPRRLARSRWLIAVGDRGQILATSCYWPEDAAWFVPEWERIVSTLRVE